VTASEFAALARSVGLTLRPGTEAEMAPIYEKLKELAQRVRAAQAEPAHVFKPPE